MSHGHQILNLLCYELNTNTYVGLLVCFQALQIPEHVFLGHGPIFRSKGFGRKDWEVLVIMLEFRVI